MLLEKKAKDMERYALLTQMSHFKVLDAVEEELFITERREISDRYTDFFSHGMTELRKRLSKGIKARMDSTFRKVVEASMKEDEIKRLKRYVYHIMKHNESPSKVLVITLEI